MDNERILSDHPKYGFDFLTDKELAAMEQAVRDGYTHRPETKQFSGIPEQK